MTITELVLEGVFAYTIWSEANLYTVWHMRENKMQLLNHAYTIVKPWPIAWGGMKLESNPQKTMDGFHVPYVIVHVDINNISFGIENFYVFNFQCCMPPKISWSMVVHYHSLDRYCRYASLVSNQLSCLLFIILILHLVWRCSSIPLL